MSLVAVVALDSLSDGLIAVFPMPEKSPQANWHTTQPALPAIHPYTSFIMPSEKAMAKAAKIIKAPVNEKSAAKVADSGEETSSEGTSSSGSDDDATSSSGSDSASGSESSSEDEELPVKVAKTTYVSMRPYPFRRNGN